MSAQLAPVIALPPRLKPDPFTDRPRNPTRAQLVAHLDAAQRWYDIADSRKRRAELRASGGIRRVKRTDRFDIRKANPFDRVCVETWREAASVMATILLDAELRLTEFDAETCPPAYDYVDPISRCF